MVVLFKCMCTMYTVGIWRELLSKLTSWTMSYSKIHVITGPVFDLNYDGLWDPIDKIIRFILNILSIDLEILILKLLYW